MRMTLSRARPAVRLRHFRHPDSLPRSRCDAPAGVATGRKPHARRDRHGTAASMRLDRLSPGTRLDLGMDAALAADPRREPRESEAGGAAASGWGQELREAPGAGSWA